MIKIRCGEVAVQAEWLTFPSGERHVQLSSDAVKLIGSNTLDVHIRANLQCSDDIFDYLLLENALLTVNAQLGIHLEIPYLPYARQDRACALGQAFSMEVLASLLRLRAKKSIVVWDAHSPVSVDLTGASCVSAAQIIQSSVALSAVIRLDSTVLVAPDHGAGHRVAEVAKAFGKRGYIQGEKSRDPMTGVIQNLNIPKQDLSQVDAVIIDDICDGGATFLALAKELKGLGCRRIVLYVTHGVFSRGLKVFDGVIDAIYTSNSLPQSSRDLVTVIDYGCWQ